MKTKDNSISYHNVTPAQRKKRKAGTTTTISTTEVVVQNRPDNFFNKYIIRIFEKIHGWLHNLNSMRDSFGRNLHVRWFPQYAESFAFPDQVWSLIPYNDGGQLTARYDFVNHRYYCQKRGMYLVHAAVSYSDVSITTQPIWDHIQLAVFKNSYASPYRILDKTPNSVAYNGTTRFWVAGMALVPMLPGDYIEIKLWHLSLEDMQINIGDNSAWAYLDVSFQGVNYKDLNPTNDLTYG